MITYYLTLQCDNCDEEILHGPCGTTLEHNGLPVIPYDVAAQTSFSCDHCGAENYTGDFELESEGGSDPEALDDEDDEDDA